MAQHQRLAEEKEDSTLTEIAEVIERLSNDLRENTLDIRMLPIGFSVVRPFAGAMRYGLQEPYSNEMSVVRLKDVATVHWAMPDRRSVALFQDQDTTTFTDTGLATATPYAYRVAAVNAHGCGNLNNTIRASIFPFPLTVVRSGGIRM